MDTTPRNKLAGLTASVASAIAADLIEARRLRHGAARMDAAAGTDTGAASSTDTGTDTGTGSSTDTGKTFTQADVDRLITQRLERERAAADRKVAEANKTADQRLADLERELAGERLARTRATVASRHGLGDLVDVLAGSSEDELEANAKRLAERLKTSTTSSSSSSSSTSKARTRRTVVETGNGAQGLTPKERAAEALRALGGNAGD